MFNSIGMIPEQLKPGINVRFILRLDLFVFDDFQGRVLTNICLIIGGYLLYSKYHHDRSQTITKPGDNVSLPLVHIKHHPEKKHKEPEPESDFELFDTSLPIANKSQEIGGFQLFLILTIPLSWMVLEAIGIFVEPINKAKSIIATVFYLIGHFLVFPCLVSYMYLFHPSSVLKQFIAVVGIQNIMITMTHLMFPNVPPIFIELYGENKTPSYEIPGYTEGLTQLELLKHSSALNGIVDCVRATEFGIFPSLNTSMLILVINYLMDLMAYKTIKVGLVVYLMFQIWSSIYLEHHWRLDILFSFIYSNIIYVFVRFKQTHVVNSTMGMRLFKHTRLENWFNPYV